MADISRVPLSFCDVLRGEPRTDPDRIAAIGHGTGGAIALELGRAGVDRRIATYGGARHAFHHPMTGADQTPLPGVGHHPRPAERARHAVVDLLAECVPVPDRVRSAGFVSPTPATIG